jgi:hypothetical protein
MERNPLFRGLGFGRGVTVVEARAAESTGSGPGRQGTLQAVNARGDAPEVESERAALGNGPKQHRGERRPPPRHVTLGAPCSHGGRVTRSTAGGVVDEDLGRMNPPFSRGRTDGSRGRRWERWNDLGYPAALWICG